MGKMSQNLSFAAVVIGALRVNPVPSAQGNTAKAFEQIERTFERKIMEFELRKSGHLSKMKTSAFDCSFFCKVLIEHDAFQSCVQLVSVPIANCTFFDHGLFLPLPC